jgi:signal transduction histidine kinase
MNNTPLFLPKPDVTFSMQQFVQKLIDDYLSQNEQLSQELYEKIAKSLVEINTQLIQLEKKTSSTVPIFSEDVRELNRLVQTTLSQIRSTEDDSNITSLSNLGLEAVLRELCLKNSVLNDFPIFFECKRSVQNWLDRSQAICLYYFVRLVLEFVSKEKWMTFISLEIQETQVFVCCQTFLGSTGLALQQSRMDQLLPVFQEWIDLWDGELQSFFPNDVSFRLTASLNKQDLRSLTD